MFNVFKVFKTAKPTTTSVARPTRALIPEGWTVTQSGYENGLRVDRAPESERFEGHDRRGKSIDRIVLHEPAMSTREATIKTLKAKNLSVHYTIDRDGTVMEHCDTGRYCVHAGIPGKTTGHNTRSIGLEFINRYYGHRANQVEDLPLYNGDFDAGIISGIWVDRAWNASTKTFANPKRTYIMMPQVQLEAGWLLIQHLMKEHPGIGWFDGVSKSSGKEFYNWQPISRHDAPGVKCHAQWAHADGRIPHYFSLLRSMGMPPAVAYTQTIKDATSMQRQTALPLWV